MSVTIELSFLVFLAALLPVDLVHSLMRYFTVASCARLGLSLAALCVSLFVMAVIRVS